MGIFEDLSQFLEARLEEFLRNNPHLELQALDEQLREQEDGTLRLILDLQRQEKQLQDDILALAQDIQLWHGRASKAEASSRMDLANAAREREAALLRQGNQHWGQMQGIKQRIEQSKDLVRQIQRRREEVRAELARVQAATASAKASLDSDTQGWNQAGTYQRSKSGADPLDAQFQRWEMDKEIEEMKRKMGS
ncbi:TIGR04376 family protein [Oscillatoria sp. FACHB-1406]|uniref:TIGR04376 family protein n=1 Tax=Oscillatoria sp. FACHB-1406 TaxID=2692846 RepID=UPI0016889D95|nr:TIGR04376 family protein [Oscillatoria sp. FACHB-1406]MBD2577415.1 TIGR04376 family protein [Oscillatoria sp. FACHB-1406]